MSIIVQKYGGTSVANAEKIKSAAKRAVAAFEAGNQVVVVVSARGKKTDELVGLAAEITSSPSLREMDMLLSTGEQESVALMAMAIQEMGVNAISLTGAQIGILTDSTFSKARIQKISSERLKSELNQNHIVIAAGFQGVDDAFNITTLGRGGSDTTATALAAVLGARECQIYTDVEGVFSSDPRLIPNARKISRISYEEMLELSSLGAGVMHSRSIEFAKKFRVPIRVRPAHEAGEGTLIAEQSPEAAPPVTGVALMRNEVRITLLELPDRPGVLSSLFQNLSCRNVTVDMIVQNIGREGVAELSFTVPEPDLAETLTAVNILLGELGEGRFELGTHVSKVSVVGLGMRAHTGVAATMFQVLADGGINIDMVTTSEIKISIMIDRSHSERAAMLVHEGFSLHHPDRRLPEIGIQADNRNHFEEQSPDTVREVVSQLANMEDLVVSSIDLDEHQSRITIDSLPDQPGVLSVLFSAVARGGVMVDMIVQDVGSNGRARVTFTVPQVDIDRCRLLLHEVLEAWPEASWECARQIAKLSVWGIGLRSHTSVGETMFRTLAESNINVQMVNTSETRISIVVAPDEGKKAQQALEAAFLRAS